MSDHVEQQLRRLRGERDQRYQQARLLYQHELRGYDEQLDALDHAYHEAFRHLRLVQGASSWWRHRTLRKRGDPPPPVPEGPTVEEQQWQAGAEGEQRLAGELMAMLPGAAWTLIKGYQNRKGEIDYLLIGPAGVLALECNHLSGTIICTQDRWVRQKYDPAGAPATQVPIVDRAGRSPSLQLNEPATVLKESLSQKGAGCEMARAVILTHPDVRLGAVDTPTVHITLLNNLQPFLWEMCRTAASSLPTQRIVECVKEDHRDWEEQSKTEAAQPEG
ncbi:MAG TPA: nuclease-related domain-containing protein [Nitrospiraceae bacterium]|nr:nuclease-related domain-containing protein [Nitrospiraceae bacterium]